jgi:hypothetical protein
MADSKEKKSTSAKQGDILARNMSGSGICIYILYIFWDFILYVVLGHISGTHHF